MATIKITFEVSNLTNVLSLYDQMQVQRSVVGPPGYADAAFITAASATKPSLTGTSEDFTNLLNKTFRLSVDGGAEQSWLFDLVNPVSLTNVITELNAHFTGITATPTVGGKIKIEGNNAGTDGVLEIGTGNANALLGFIDGDKVNGLDANIILVALQTVYQYDDQSGLATNYYRSRYYNSISGVFSSWSDWIQGTTGAALSNANLIMGRIKLAKLDGTAWEDAEVLINNVYNPLKVEGYGIFGAAIMKLTDALGQAEFSLVKGATVDVIIKGTSIIRRIIVPTSGTEFDLLDDSLVQGDAFEIVVPDLPSAPRMS